MKKLIIATWNEAKLNQLRGALAPLGLEISGMLGRSDISPAKEDGVTAQANARKKAITYAQALGENVLSMDNALYLDDLKESEQPGIHVRRINGTDDRATDEELLVHYTGLVKRFGEKENGHWEFAVCLATPEGEYRETTIVSPRVFTSQPSQRVLKGYPLESIQIDPGSGKYISEMTQAEQDTFWQRAIGAKLQKFVRGGI